MNIVLQYYDNRGTVYDASVPRYEMMSYRGTQTSYYKDSTGNLGFHLLEQSVESKRSNCGTVPGWEIAVPYDDAKYWYGTKILYACTVPWFYILVPYPDFISWRGTRIRNRGTISLFHLLVSCVLFQAISLIFLIPYQEIQDIESWVTVPKYR